MIDWMAKIDEARTRQEALEKMMSENQPESSPQPRVNVWTPDHSNIPIYDPIKSLRDWFAGQALIGVLAGGTSPAAAMQCASDAYRLADAMIAMRDMGKP
jgi:hypothetical protein